MAKLIGVAKEMVKNSDRMYSGILWRENKAAEVTEIYGKYKERKENAKNCKSNDNGNPFDGNKDAT